MPELEFLEGYLAEGEAATSGAAEAKAGNAVIATPKKAAEPVADNLKVKDAETAVSQNPAPSSFSGPKFSLPSPGPIGGLLLLIIFLVLAIMPVPGVGVPRLTLLWNVLMRGGAFKGDEAASASPVPSSGSSFDAYIQQPSPYTDSFTYGQDYGMGMLGL